MDAAEALAGFALPLLPASARMDVRDEAGGRRASVGTGGETDFHAFMSVEPQPGPCGHRSSSRTHFQRVWKPFCVFNKRERKRKKLGLSPYLEMPAGCKYLKVALLNQNGF